MKLRSFNVICCCNWKLCAVFFVFVGITHKSGVWFFLCWLQIVCVWHKLAGAVIKRKFMSERSQKSDYAIKTEKQENRRKETL